MTIHKTVPCAGCSVQISDHYDPYGTPTGVEISVGTGTALVCYSGRGRRGARVDCARKAREKASKCPGCDSPKVEPGTICETCRENIDKGLAADSADPLSRMKLDAWALVGPGFHSSANMSDLDASGAFLDLLTQAVAGRGAERSQSARSRHGDAWVEVTGPQREALVKLSAVWRDTLDAAREAGHREGRSLLLGLAAGTVGTREFDDAQARASEREKPE